MANSNRLATHYLNELAQSPEALHKQGFEGLLRYLDANSPLHQRLGYSISIKQDGYRLGQTPLMHFHASAFTNVTTTPTTGVYKLNNAYWGLFGINGPLPAHFTEYAIERKSRYNDVTLTEFCDVFHHRFISLFYRAWADAQPAISHDFAQSNRDIFARRVAVFGGMTQQNQATTEKTSKPTQNPTPKHLDAYLAGLFSLKQRGAGALRQAIQSYLGYSVEIQEFVGCWYAIPKQELSLLGGLNCQLGKSAIIGKSSYQRSFNIAIQIGPLNFSEYSTLLADPQYFSVIRQIAYKILGAELTVTIHLLLAPQQKQPAVLGGSLLGKNSWATSSNDCNSIAHIAYSSTSEYST